jgi:hypothetical protein
LIKYNIIIKSFIAQSAIVIERPITRKTRLIAGQASIIRYIRIIVINSAIYFTGIFECQIGPQFARTTIIASGAITRFTKGITLNAFLISSVSVVSKRTRSVTGEGLRQKCINFA